MKVIFLEDVPSVASLGEIKEVSNGYGRNFLIPKKLAALAGPGLSNQLEARLRAQSKKQAQQEAEMNKLAEEIDGKEIVLKAKAGTKDRLYGRITSADIAAELESAIGVVVDKRKLELSAPIRQLGSYEVIVRLGKDITPKIKVTVTEEETT